MPRNSSAKTKQVNKQAKHPKEKYQKLQLAKKSACFRFWVYLETNGEEGWNPDDKPGLIWLHRSSQLIKSDIKEKSWRRIGHVSAHEACFYFIILLLIIFCPTGYGNIGQTITRKRNKN